MLLLTVLVAGVLLPLRQAGAGLLVPSREEQPEGVREAGLKWGMEGIRTAIEEGFLGVALTLTGNLLSGNPDPETLEVLLNQRLHIALARGDLPMAEDSWERLREAGLQPRPLLEGLHLYFTGGPDAVEPLLPVLRDRIQDPDSLAWLRLLEALILSRGDSVEAANEAFREAGRLAPNPLVREQFEIIRFREELAAGTYDEAGISALRESVRAMRGERAGFEAARLLAMALSRSGDSQAAIEVLNEHLAMPALREFNLRPDLLFLLAVIAGPDSARGRLALKQIIGEQAPPARQSTAMTLLAQNSTTAELREDLLQDIDGWLEEDPPHPLTDRLLAYKAYFLSQDRSYDQAEASARSLLDQFPSSAFADTALWILAYVSWNQSPPRYRTAADFLNQLRQRLEDPGQVLITGILIADCYFLNGDYASASDAYGAVFRDAPAARAASIFFQRVESEIKADRPASAAELINAASIDPRIEETVRWQAEWNLLDYLRREGRIDLAFERIQRILQPPDGDPQLSPSLDLRFRWLEARLTLEAGTATEAVRRTEFLMESLSGDRYTGLPDSLLEEVRSHLLLLRGEALIASGRKAEGIQSFSELRAAYPESGPAILSYLVESRSESGEDNLVSAQQSLVGLVDRFPSSEYAPIALWEAALNAEQRGLNIHLQEAIGILERLVSEYPDHELVYFARLKQGDLARRLNDFPTALLLYERILTQYPDHPERYRAEISRADCLMALGSQDSTRYDMAAIIYERNCLLPTVPLPVRMEAGFKWGHSLRQMGDLQGCEAAYWLLHERFVRDANMARSVVNEEVARYWLARVLFELGDIQIEKGELAKGRQIFQFITDMRLPGAALALRRLEALP